MTVAVVNVNGKGLHRERDEKSSANQGPPKSWFDKTLDIHTSELGPFLRQVAWS
jgi:hypothetical protein